MKSILYISAIFLFVLGSPLLFSQVVIDGNPSSTATAHSTAMLHIKNQNEAAAKAMGLPVVANKTELPKYNASQPDLYDDEATMTGMLMYQSDEKVVKVYDGTKWDNAFSVETPNLTRARVAANYNISGAGGALNYTYFNDLSNGFIDYLSLKTGVLSANKFKIRQTGVYRINITLELNLSNTNLLATAYVNDTYRFALKFPVGSGGTTRIANYEFTMLLKQGEEVRFDVSSESGNSFTVYGTNLSTIMFEKIM